jgi:hypothetical protein
VGTCRSARAGSERHRGQVPAHLEEDAKEARLG